MTERSGKPPFLVLWLMVVCWCFLVPSPVAAQDRSAKSIASDQSDPSVDPGKGYALIIGIDDYSGGWPKLDNAVADATAVAEALEKLGYRVTLGKNSDSNALRTLLEDFVYEKGAEANAHLLIWFAGHGHTINGEGYIVPADAPMPDASDAGFRRKAVSLRRFGEFMREIRSAHVLGVFDSCFSGTIFGLDRGREKSPAVELAMTLPSRQFISSGEANQLVSDDTTFRRLFLDAISGRAPSADANGDRYLTATELGVFLQDRITNATAKRQTPRYGKLDAVGYDGGDFVFQLPGAATASAKSVPPAGRRIITDRNGAMLATNVEAFSAVVDPALVTDEDVALELLSTLDPAQDLERLAQVLAGDKPVELIAELSEDQRNRIAERAIAGIQLRSTVTRVHPAGDPAGVIVGDVGPDGRGLSGLEKYIDVSAPGAADEPLRSSIDLRLQNYIAAEVEVAKQRYKAKGVAAIITDVRTGEILALASSSVQNSAGQALSDLESVGALIFTPVEMGSIIKAVTIAVGLEAGTIETDSQFDATAPITIGRHTIRDFHGEGRVLSLPEVFIYSSNIGSARIADTMGIERHRHLLHALGLLDPVTLEIGTTGQPGQPREWRKVHSIVAAFGHGFSTSPLNMTAVAAALVNGGLLIPPTLIKRSSSEAMQSSRRVLRTDVSDYMRSLYRLSVEKGSGRNAQLAPTSRAAIAGFKVGGRTGTAEKVVNGRYDTNARRNTFVGVMPIDDPRYAVFVLIDEPQPEQAGTSATAGSNAAPLVGKILERAGFLLALAEKNDAQK